MDSRQHELWRRIQAFQFDDNDAEAGFARRLARENGWSDAFTARAIEEYRKLLLLAATAGHPISPPDAVDQVWHLNLLYTRSYWDELCDKVLGFRFHHEPATGASGHHEALHRAYHDTLASYRATFGAAPPADLWPGPGSRGSAPRHRRVDLNRNWVISRTGLVQVLGGIVLLLALLAIAAGCGAASAQLAIAPAPAPASVSLNLFDLRGPHFLALYAGAFAAAMMFGWRIRAGVRGGRDAGALVPLDLNPTETAYLRGGARQALEVTIASLVDGNLLVADPKQRLFRSGSATAPQEIAPLEKAVHGSAASPLGANFHAVQSAARRHLEHIREGLVSRGLLVDPDRAASARLLATALALLVPAVGVVKIGVGIARDRPVLFLVIACAVSVPLALIAFARPLHRTRRGDALLARLQTTYGDLRGAGPELAGADLTMAVALFGLAALTDTPLAPLRQALRPPASDGSGSGGYFASSCGGGSSCGSGSSCGGGCGGCGGS